MASNVKLQAGGSSGTTTISTSETTDRTITVPDATDTLVGKATTDVLTNKTATGLVTTAGTLTVPSLTMTHGTNLTTATADTWENDAVAMYNTIDTTNGRRFNDSWNYFRLTGAGSAISTIADFFGSTDGIPLVANGVYEIEWDCWAVQNTGAATNWTWTIVTATTALASINAYYIINAIAGIATAAAPLKAGATATTSSSLALPVTGSMAAATHHCLVRAVVVAGNGSSNTRLRLTSTANNATPQLNSFFKVRRLPAANTGTYAA